MKLVYICSPLRGDVEKNKERANNYCRFAVKEEVHTIFTQFLDDDIEEERTKGINLGLELLKHCNELWVFGDTISDGMKSEIKIAEKFEMPVIRFSSDCKRI
jgi:hypothetical protein